MRTTPCLSRMLLAVLAALLPPAAVAGNTNPWLEEAMLTASDGAASDRFGRSVAVDGDTAVVGAPFAGVDGNSSQGAAYILVRAGDTWTEQARLTAADGAAEDRFGQSVAISADTVLVGASQAQVDGQGNQGAAYVFVWDGAQWVEQAKLTGSESGAGSQLGFSVALAGDTAVAGAALETVNGNAAQGAAYVFTRSGETWSEQAWLTASDGTSFAAFGIAVALSGARALVGAEGARVEGVSTGAAYVFGDDGGTWSEQAKLVAADGAAGDRLGRSVALSGDTALSGAPEENDGQGAAYVFVHDGANWLPQARLVGDGADSGVKLGSAVALVPQRVLVGAPSQGDGTVYTFGRVSDGAWVEQAVLTAAGTRSLGASMALSGNTALIGAPGTMIDGNTNQGAAYVFVETEMPVLAFDPASLDFGELEIGTTSDPQTSMLANVGLAGATGLGFNLSGSGDYQVDTGACGNTLPSGERCEVSVTFTPEAPGPANATLAAEADGGVSATLNLSGAGPQAVLVFDPGSLDFGAVEVDTTSAARTATLANTGSAEAAGLSFTLSGSGDYPVDTSACGNTLAVGASCEVSVTFAPTEPGPANASLEVDADDGAGAALPLSGTGTPPAPVLAFDPGSLNFGQVEVGTTSAARTATLANTGSAEATGLGFSPLGNGFEADTGACGDTLAAGESCEVSVTFTPNQPGPVGATLEAAADDGAGAALALSGTTPGVLSADPLALEFGAVVVDARTAYGSIKVRHAGPAGTSQLVLAAIELDGAVDFEPAGGTCIVGRALAPNETCTIMLQFRPAAVDDFVAAAVITAEDGQSATIDLTGGGVTAVTEPPDTDRVSLDPDGNERDWTASFDHDLSADGRFMTFQWGIFGEFNGISCGQFISCRRVFWRDRQTQTTKLVSARPDGSTATGNSIGANPSISADGRFVVFRHVPNDAIVPGTEGGYFVRDMFEEVTEHVKLPTADGETANASFFFEHSSADGRYASFRSRATNLVPGDPGDDTMHVVVHDRAADTVERVSVASDGTPGNADSLNSTLSFDGRYVVFGSLASNLVPGDTSDVMDVFIHDRATGTTERVSVASDGREANGPSGGVGKQSWISADGRFVTFLSVATNLVPGECEGHGGTDFCFDIFVRDRVTGTTRRVSEAPDGSQSNLESDHPRISADGRFVAFSSFASNLVPDDTNGEPDVFVHDLVTGTTERVSLAYDGSESDGFSWAIRGPAMSFDGRFVAFPSWATNLVPGDTNAGDWPDDWFVRDRGQVGDGIFRDRFEAEE